jgi:hypothetical protein
MARCEMKVGQGICTRQASYRAKGKHDTKSHKYCATHAKRLKKYGWVDKITKL